MTVGPEIWKPLTPIDLVFDFGITNCPSDADTQTRASIDSQTSFINHVDKYGGATGRIVKGWGGGLSKVFYQFSLYFY